MWNKKIIRSVAVVAMWMFGEKWAVAWPLSGGLICETLFTSHSLYILISLKLLLKFQLELFSFLINRSFAFFQDVRMFGLYVLSSKPMHIIVTTLPGAYGLFNVTANVHVYVSNASMLSMLIFCFCSFYALARKRKWSLSNLQLNLIPSITLLYVIPPYKTFLISK